MAKDEQYSSSSKMLFGGSAQKQLSQAGVPSGLASSTARVMKKEKAPKNTMGPGSADTLERRAKAVKKGRPSFGRNQSTPATDSGSQQDDFLNLLASLMGGGGGGGGSRAAYSADQIASAQAGMGANRAKMEALYKRYAEDIAAREADIAANYGTAATNLGGIYDTATGNINKAYEAARAAQNQQLLNLGMTEQTPVQTFGNQTAATTGLENLRAAVLAQNEASRKAAITNQRLAAEGATREGVQKLSAYDAEVARAIAEMQNATVSTGGGGGGGGGLSANQYASLILQKQKMDQDAQIAAAKIAANQKTTPNLQAAFNNVANTTYTPEQLKAVELQMRYGG